MYFKYNVPYVTMETCAIVVQFQVSWESFFHAALTVVGADTVYSAVPFYCFLGGVFLDHYWSWRGSHLAGSTH